MSINYKLKPLKENKKCSYFSSSEIRSRRNLEKLKKQFGLLMDSVNDALLPNEKESFMIIIVDAAYDNLDPEQKKDITRALNELEVKK